MVDFSTVKNKFNTALIIKQLKMIDESGVMNKDPHFGDYNRFGCEFILNGGNTGSDYNIAELIEDEYPNVYAHGIEFVNHWDSWLFYSPSDIRGLLFDFSRMYRDNKILAYDGLNGPIKKYEVVREFTIDEFLNEYGTKRLYSVAHWNVTWKNIGFSWNN